MNDDATPEDIQPLYDRVTAILDGHSATLQAAVLSNVLAAFAIATYSSTGIEPFNTIRTVRQNARLHVWRNMKQLGILVKAPKDAKPN